MPVSSAAHTVPTHPHLRLGRKPRTHRRMLNFSAMVAIAGAILTKPMVFDYTVGLPDDLGTLGNDQVGDCTAAAKYHRLQMMQWRLYKQLVPGAQLTALTEQFYAASTGWDPTDPNSDQGGNMQDLAAYLVRTGMPMPDGSVDRFIAAFEVDVGRVADLSYCGSVCGGLDIGIRVTTSVMPRDGSPPPPVWDVSDDDEELGGHDIYCMARLSNGNWKVNSWGGWYQLTPAFWNRNVQEAYAYVSQDWIDKTGKTPLGLNLTGWQEAIAGHATPV